MPPKYAELHCLSNYSFLTGASHPEELVERAVELGYAALAITDECSVAGVVRAHVAADPHDLKLIIGSELRLDCGMRLVILATNRNGYGNLCELITQGRRSADKGRYRLGRTDLEHRLADCLLLWLPGRRVDPDQACWLKTHFSGRCWLAVALHNEAGERRHLQHLLRQAQRHGLKPVAVGSALYHRRSRRVLQDTMTAIRHGCTLPDAGFALYCNGERHLRPRPALERIYPPALLAETLEISDRCRFSLSELRYEYPREIIPPGRTAGAWLRHLVTRGAGERWPRGTPSTVRRQLEHELGLIAELGYEHYFLTVHDVVSYARRHGILCQGRGSAANSAVCYCLGITEVDPARSQLLFERFISRERNEPPDIDVDFEHERREEVIQYIYAKYGRDRAALAATVVRYRSRSAVRDVGRALGMESTELEALAGAIGWSYRSGLSVERLREGGFDPDSPVLRRLAVLTGQIMDFPRHLSQHVGGFVISRDALSRLVPIENAAMPGRTVIQWDKDDLDALGLLKVDCLALGMLSAIRRALHMLGELRGSAMSLADVPSEDPQTYAMVQRADTVGVFQIESRAQMAMLPRLKPRCFYDLVIEVAIVRPGPIQGGMVHPYLRRRSGSEAVDYPSEHVRSVLERTLGVPIFQEQVMQLAVVAAGFSPGEADQLRRAMAAWRRRGGLEKFRERLIRGMFERGYGRDFAERLYQQIEGFGEYGFPESHAASFALLVYVSAWIKCHHPAVFCCALLNSQPMGFYAPSQLVQDARRHGVEVRPVTVLHSDWDCTLEPGGESGPALRLGMRMVRGLSRRGAEQLLAARTRHSPDRFAALIRSRLLNRRDFRALARADALQAILGHRRQAVWAAQAEGDTDLLGQPCAVPEPRFELRQPAVGEEVVADYQALSLSLRSHPLALLRNRLQRLKLLSSQQLAGRSPCRAVAAAGLVINRQRPATAKGVVFATLEDEHGFINLLIRAEVAERYRQALLGARLLKVQGGLQRHEGVVHVLVEHLDDLSWMLGELPTRSRDFH